MHKLVDQHGTILGVITIPGHWDECLAESRSVRFAVCDGPPIRAYQDFDPSAAILVQYGGLTRSYAMRGALELWGISLEQFEKMDGCTFSPSAAYLRSIME